MGISQAIKLLREEMPKVKVEAEQNRIREAIKHLEQTLDPAFEPRHAVVLNDQQIRTLLNAARVGDFSAVVALGKTKGLETEKTLTALISTADVCTQFAALNALASMGSSEPLSNDSIKFLDQFKEQTHSALRWATLAAMAHCGPKSVNLLSAELNSLDGEFRDDTLLWLVGILEKQRQPWLDGQRLINVFSPIVRFDPSPFRRVTAVRGLKSLGKNFEKLAVAELSLVHQNDSDPWLRLEAAAALLEQGEPPLPLQAELVETLTKGSVDLQCRAAELMAESDRKEFLPELLSAAGRLAQQEPWPWSVNFDERAAQRQKVCLAVARAAEKLGSYRQRATVELSALLLEGTPGEKMAALLALSLKGDRAALFDVTLASYADYDSGSNDSAVFRVLYDWAICMLQPEPPAYLVPQNPLEPEKQWARPLWEEYRARSPERSRKVEF